MGVRLVGCCDQVGDGCQIGCLLCLGQGEGEGVTPVEFCDWAGDGCQTGCLLTRWADCGCGCGGSVVGDELLFHGLWVGECMGMWEVRATRVRTFDADCKTTASPAVRVDLVTHPPVFNVAIFGEEDWVVVYVCSIQFSAHKLHGFVAVHYTCRKV